MNTTQLTFHVVSDINEAKTYWEQFSPHKTIDDEWEFRFLFSESLNLPFHFIVGFDGNKPVGLLPLLLNECKGLGPKLLHIDEPFLEFFGGVDTDDNRIFVLPGYEDTIPQFLSQIKTPAILTSLKEPYHVDNTDSVFYLDRFELDLNNMSSFEDILQKHFDGKSRQKLINRINKLNKEYTLEVKTGSQDDLELIFTLSKQRFGEKSSFHMEYRKDIYKKLMERFQVDLFVIYLNGTPKAASCAIKFKESYISINIGYDYEVRDLGKLVIVTQLKRAFENKCTRYDAGQGDNGWKEHFHLTKIPQYKLTLNYTQPEETLEN